jgi:hypothetical protein
MTCEQHTQLFSDVQVIKETTTNLDKRINGALDIVAKHIDAGSRWRFAIVGVAITLVVNIVIAAYWNGQMVRQIQVNTERLTRVESRMMDGCLSEMR